jgi:hypothetical protein
MPIVSARSPPIVVAQLGGRHILEVGIPPQAQPEQTVARAKTSVRTSEDAELVTQCNRLKNKVSPGVQGGANPLRDGQKELNHRVSVWPAAVRTSTIL